MNCACCWEDLDATAPDLRQLAAHLLEAADHLDRLNQGQGASGQ